MLSSVTINCQVTKIVIYPGFQLSVLQSASQMSKVPTIAPIDVLQWRYIGMKVESFLRETKMYSLSQKSKISWIVLWGSEGQWFKETASQEILSTQIFSEWTNKMNLNTTLLRSTCIPELNITILQKITILQNYNLLAQEIVLLFTNEYSTNIFFHIFHSVAVVDLKCLQGLHFCQLSGTHWTTSPSIALESVPMEALLLPTFFALFLWTVLL